MHFLVHKPEHRVVLKQGFKPLRLRRRKLFGRFAQQACEPSAPESRWSQFSGKVDKMVQYHARPMKAVGH